MQRILVNGGASLLGSHLCEELLARGARVLCVDDTTTGQTQNLIHLFGNQRFEYLWPQSPALECLEVDEIYHLPSPAPGLFDPTQLIAHRHRQARAMLELAGRNQAKLLVAGICEAGADPCGTRACLDEGQRRLETFCLQERRLRGLTLKLARVFNPYGPQRLLDEACVISRLILRALRQEPLVLPGGGVQPRSFCHVDDLVAGLVSLMAAPEACTGPVNLGSAKATTTLELAQRIIALTGSSSHPMALLEPEEQERLPDFELARTALDWEPKIDLEEGLRWNIEAVRWLEERQAML